MVTGTCVKQIFILRVLIAITMAMLIPGAVMATGINHNVPAGSDIVMKDLRWPGDESGQWDQGTYYCFWYVSFVPKKDKAMPTFYGGCVAKGPENNPGLFHTYWGNILNIHEGEEFYRKGFGAEGAKGGASGQPSFLHPNNWYRNVLRVFPPKEGADQNTYVGWWVKDVDNNKWYTHSVVSIDVHATGVSGNGGFVEALAPETVHRAFERRLGYCRLDGKWAKSDTVPTKSPQFFNLIENDTVLRYDKSGPDYDSGSETVNFTTVQPDAPTLDQPAIKEAKALIFDTQIVVEWVIPTTASPQLGYKLEVFDRKGKLLKTFDDVAPHVTAKRLDLDDVAKTVKLTVIDIFDQKTSVTLTAKHTRAATGKKPSRLRSGLKYTYYEPAADMIWKEMPDFAEFEVSKQGLVKTVDDTIKEGRSNLYAMQYKGFIKAESTGLYVIELGTCDGSILKIDGKVLADNDGIHSTSVSQYPIALSKGDHAFELSYFKGGRSVGSYASDGKGVIKVLLSWEGPGFEKRDFTADDYVCENDADIPSIAMPQLKTVLDDNRVKISPVVEARGHRINKVQLYYGSFLLDTVTQDEGFAFSNLLPEGVSNYWVRLWYDDNNSVDSDVIVLDAKNRTDGPWSFTAMDQSIFPHAVRAKEGKYDYRGDAFCFGYQKISGDFELTARVVDMDMTTQENGIHPRNWIGLYLQTGITHPYSGSRFGIYCLTDGTVRGSQDFPDLAGTKLAGALYPAGHRWLKIIRRGDCFESYTSGDGETWQKAAEHIMKGMKKEVYGGILFSPVPNKSRSLFSGSFDNVTLKLSAPEPSPRQSIAKIDLPQLGQIAALVQGSDNALYARVIGHGIRKSTDDGQSWTSIDTGLMAPEALSVRSIAVHPTESSIILRGGGCVVDGKFKSTLHRSTDSGKTWTLVSTEIDFDGQGPTASFGETISFSECNPNLVAAGGETKGVFLSYDKGANWTYYKYADQRVTCLAFRPETMESKGVIPSKKRDLLVIGTFDDSEFATLGLPKPASPLDSSGRIYWNTIDASGKIKESNPCNLEDFGITNIGFGWVSNFATFATTRGLFYTYQRGGILCQRRDEMTSDTVFTALGYRLFVRELRENDSRTRVNSYAAPLITEDSNVIFCAKDRTTFKWSKLSAYLNSPPTSILADKSQLNTLYVCNREGIFKSSDNGKSFKLVLSGIAMNKKHIFPSMR